MLRPPKSAILFSGLWRFTPPYISCYVEYLPFGPLKRLRNFLTVSQNAAKAVLEQKACSAGEGDRDILGILGMHISSCADLEFLLIDVNF